MLAFLSAWTTELHAHGYLSGVYSSANSGISDFVAAEGTGFVEPDEIWIADWNGEQNTTSAYVPSGDWANHQRLHQYQGGHNATYGGATINIDSDYVDAGGAGGNALFPNGTFVQVSGSGPASSRSRAARRCSWSDWSDVGGAQPYTVITPQQFDSLNPVPTDGTMIETDTGAVYRDRRRRADVRQRPARCSATVQPVLVDIVGHRRTPATRMSHLNAVPVNGTFLTTTSGLNYRVAGGAPIGVTNGSRSEALSRR